MNPYLELGVDERAPLSTIRSKYLSLLLQYHPDKQDVHECRCIDEDKRTSCLRGKHCEQLRAETAAKFHRIVWSWEQLKDEAVRKSNDYSLNLQQQVLFVNQSYEQHHNVLQIDLDSFSYDCNQGHHQYACRCGGFFVVTDDELAQIVDAHGCDTIAANEKNATYELNKTRSADNIDNNHDNKDEETTVYRCLLQCAHCSLLCELSFSEES